MKEWPLTFKADVSSASPLSEQGANAWNISFKTLHGMVAILHYQLSWWYLITLLYSPNEAAPQFLLKLTPFIKILL